MRLTKLFRRDKYDPDDAIVSIKRAMIENGAIDAELDVAPRIVAEIYAALGLMLGNAPNYVEASIEVKPAKKMPHEAFTVTVRRNQGLTPHGARRIAEDALQSVLDILDDPELTDSQARLKGQRAARRVLA